MIISFHTNSDLKVFIYFDFVLKSTFFKIDLISLVVVFNFNRSDVLGQFMPLVGVDWSHIGVARLFSAIKVCCTFYPFL